MKFLHPISYSLVINLLCLAISGFLAYAFASPWVFIVAILISNHALERFQDEQREREMDEVEEEYSGERAGFLADISKR